MVHGHGTRGGGGGRVMKEICRSDHFGGSRPRPSISDVFRPIAGTEHLPQLWPAVTGDAGKMWRPWPSAALHIALAVRAFTGSRECPAAGAIPLMTIKAWVCSLAWGSCPGKAPILPSGPQIFQPSLRVSVPDVPAYSCRSRSAWTPTSSTSCSEPPET